MKRRTGTRTALALFAGLLATACSTPSPEPAISSAELALQRAEQSQARRYAPEELAVAREELTQARGLHRDRSDWLKARRLAEKAAVDALLAEETAKTARLERIADERAKDLEALESETQRRGSGAP
jgi:septal ring factor EnvC (AmiA/AmiB activator)